jgi:LPXTG-site transpeptidase (sortase) family protein
MALNTETLSIGSIRLRKQYPLAQVQAQRRSLDPVIHPDAAAAARAKIAALPDVMPIVSTNIPATRTADLVTDKQKLAGMTQTTAATRRPVIPSAVQPVLTAIGIFLVVLLLFKSPIILSELNYSLGHKSPAAPAASTAGAIAPTDNSIIIPKINVNAPIEYISSVQENDILTALESGVVHYANTALPGQPGNVAIFGHSSNDWWEPGNYKFVFVLLDKLSPGDIIYIDYQGTRYAYQVQSSTVVDPTDVAVLNPTPTPTLTLITCSPPGTSLRRLVVTAKQITPTPSSATPAPAPPQTTTTTSLPSSSPGFFTQIQQAWNGVVHGFESAFGAGNQNNSSGSGTPAATPGEIPATN